MFPLKLNYFQNFLKEKGSNIFSKRNFIVSHFYFFSDKRIYKKENDQSKIFPSLILPKWNQKNLKTIFSCSMLTFGSEFSLLTSNGISRSRISLIFILCKIIQISIILYVSHIYFSKTKLTISQLKIVTRKLQKHVSYQI